jgi:hypothetical protein
VREENATVLLLERSPEEERGGNSSFTEGLMRFVYNGSEDKPGGAGDIGTNYVAHATPDGDTLLVTTNATIAINPQLFKDIVKFNPVTDFALVSLLAKSSRSYSS